MSATVTRTKLLIPRRRDDLLSRPRLLRLLEDILDYPFTLISAPAGYGKTSLLVDLVHQAKFPVCWLTLDKLDQDPQRFLDHFLGCIQLRFPDFGEISSSFSEGHHNPLDHPDQLISTIVNELYETISEHIVIVLDDFHLISNDPQIRTFISKFGQMSDENIHLVIASRNQFAFPDIPLLTAKRMIKGIGYDDLVFNEDEIRSLFSEIFDRDITEEQTKCLENDTEGWITGLFLSRNDPVPNQDKATLVTGVDIFDYLAEQAFLDQPVLIREFLLQSSIFDEFSQKLCFDVLGWPNKNSWNEIIDHIFQQNLFIQQVNDERPWFRYHNLFLGYLKDAFARTQPELEHKLLKKLVNAYTHDSEWEKAHEVAQRLGDFNIQAQVIDMASSDLFHSGRILILSSWLSKLPNKIIYNFPSLRILVGICNTSLGKPDMGLRQLNEIIKLPDIVSNPLLITRTYLCLATTNRLIGNYKEALRNIKEIQRISRLEELSWKINAEFHREAGLIHNYSKNNSISLDYLYSSLNIYSSHDDQNNSALVHSDIGLVCMDIGDYKSAEFHFRQSLDTWTIFHNLNQLSIVYNNIGNMLILTGKYTEANENLSLGLAYSTASANTRIEAYIHASFGDLAFSLGSYLVSIESYQNAKNLAQLIHEDFLNSYTHIRLLSIGRIVKNVQIYERNFTFGEHNSKKYLPNRCLWFIEKGLLCISPNKYLLGKLNLAVASFTIQRMNRPIEMAYIQIAQAFLEFNAGKKANALKFLSSATSITKKVGTNQPLLPMLSRHFNNFYLMLKETSDADLIQLRTDLIEFRKNLPRFRQEIFPEMNYQIHSSRDLKIKAFGKTQIWKNGERLTSSEWIHQKTVRELFFYLISRSEGVTREEIGLDFWPDSSPSNLTRQFKNAIYRLRRAVGKEQIIYDSATRTYTFNKDLDYFYDVDEFITLLHYARTENEPEGQLKYLLQALDLYKHPFASDLDGIWVEPIRRKLYLQFEKSTLDAAWKLLNYRQYYETLDICDNLLSIDPCQEQAYQICLHTYHSLDDSTGLMRSYNTCKNNLSNILGIQPSSKTEELYSNFTLAK